MEHGEHVEAVAREVDALTAALAGGPASARVPTCPDWTVRDLGNHVGGFCAFWTHVLCEGTGRSKTPFADPRDDSALPGWFSELGGYLLRELRATPADTAVWTWYKPDQSARFVARRCAHELSVHRYDAQAARDACRPIEPPALAVDGIDEIFDRLVTRRARTGQAAGQTLHLHGTDDGIDAEWLVTLHPDRIEVARTHAKGDLALRGAVSDLELLLCGRPALGPVERFGDESILDLWCREFRF
jgi:uncharacterized protein (TIGR03083 family)